MGDWHVLDALVVGVGGGAAPASIAAGPLLTVVAKVASTHFQTDGQSESEVQLASVAWQEPGKDEVVTHTGAGAGSPSVAGAEPEQVPVVVG
jgi:hypothetical protein